LARVIDYDLAASKRAAWLERDGRDVADRDDVFDDIRWPESAASAGGVGAVDFRPDEPIGDEPALINLTVCARTPPAPPEHLAPLGCNVLLGAHGGLASRRGMSILVQPATSRASGHGCR
jgi:hypothetical protein